MVDVVVVGNGRTGSQVAARCSELGLIVRTIDVASTAGSDLQARGFIAGPLSVAALDPAIGDEKEVLKSRAIVVATGSRNGAANTGFLGLDKLGIVKTYNCAIVVDETGRSSVPTVFAVGSCAATASGKSAPLAAEVAAAIATLLGQTAQPVSVE